MAARAWSLRALTKPLSTSDALGHEASAVALCMERASLSPDNAAFFLLNYIGAVWEMWDFTPADAHALAKLAIELNLDVSTVAALVRRLAEEEATAAFGADGLTRAASATPSAEFPCTCTLLRTWAGAVNFPTAFSMPDRVCILDRLAAQAQRPGFKDAAGPVMLELVHDCVTADSDTVPIDGERWQRSCRCAAKEDKKHDVMC